MEALRYLISVYTTGQLIYICLTFGFYFQTLDNSPSWMSMKLNFAVNIFLFQLYLVPYSLCLLGKQLVIRLFGTPSVRSDEKTVWFAGIFSFEPSSIEPPFSTIIIWSSIPRAVQQGNLALEIFFIDNRFESFKQLAEKCNLPNPLFFSCLQTRHFIQSQTRLPQAPGTNMTVLFSLHPTGKGILSFIYVELADLKYPFLERMKTA